MLFAFLLLACAYALPFDLNLEAIGGTKVRFSLMNTEIDTLTFLRWGTPLDKSDTVLRSDMFAVENESGERATYSGIIVKRLTTVGDFIGANPGQTLVAELDLTKGYSFYSAGTYLVWLSTTIMVANNSTTDLSQFEPFEVTSEPIKIQISPSAVTHPLIRHPLMRTNLSAPPTLSCSSTQISDINSADLNGKQIIATLQRYLTSCTLSGYTTWMGKCDDSRYKTVDLNVDAIASRINGAYQVDCAGKECSDNIYAYVYPTDTATHTVYVCGVFWSAPVQACRYDSKPGTLLHEISHFNDVAGTGDHAYGQAACKNLASSSPALAIRNADSYEYFSESCYSS